MEQSEEDHQQLKKHAIMQRMCMNKPRIEAAASEATGMKVRINGAMKFTLFPRGHISLEDIQIQNNGEVVVTAKRAEMDIGRLPLLRREIQIQQVILIAPKFFATRDKKGHFNFETSEGRLDFVHERFEDITIAVLDAKDCAKYSQRIDGRFNDPRIEKPSALHMLMGPIRSLGKKP